MIDFQVEWNHLLEQCKVRKRVQGAISVVADVETGGIPFPKRAAEAVALLLHFKLLDLLPAAPIFFRIVTKVTVISAVPISVMTTWTLILPFISTPATAIALLATYAHVWLPYVTWSIIVLHRNIANREGKDLSLRC